MNLRIEFDGGTSCNIPRLGYGNGYGSYRVNGDPVHRCNFNRPMSANAAEITTLVHAIRALREWVDIPATTLTIFGDSRIALKWANKAFQQRPLHIAQKTSPAFKQAIMELREAMRGFRRINTHWQPRVKSVATFGH